MGVRLECYSLAHGRRPCPCDPERCCEWRDEPWNAGYPHLCHTPTPGQLITTPPGGPISLVAVLAAVLFVLVLLGRA